MKKNKKNSSGGAFGGAPARQFRNAPALDAAWLAQFTPIDESALTPAQLEVWREVQKEWPDAKLGKRDTRTSFYLIDPEAGPIAGDLPR
jgi:hypothetical protein